MIRKESMDDTFKRPYSGADVEEKIYTLWEKSGFFNPDVCVEKGITSPEASIFSIALPPPNVTGVLHIGHAFEDSIQDTLIRYHRMKGDRTLWIPGTDHAAIATEAKVSKILYEEEKKTRDDIGRDEFLKRAEEFARGSHDTIVDQVKKMGASLDWSREAYTLDEKRSLAVRTAFKRMYDAGLIYRGNRIVNWDPRLKTNVSDSEIEWKEEVSPFYYLRYGPFTIATARPETKFGDKYVVMHPDDKRYEKYGHGEKIDVEWINGKVTATIIKDEAIDMEFGTGVMTITPWHDITDFDIAERHKLDREQIIDLDGKLLLIAGEFAGMKIKDAREKIVEKLKAKGFVEKIDERYAHRVATNGRGGGRIEPQIREQWFVDVDRPFVLQHSGINNIPPGTQTTLKDIMREAVASGQIKILPERFEKIHYNWVDNLRDWCISRQLWFGHRIPVWYRDTEVYVGVEEPEGDGWEQDPDTLDTWFSSGMWTFSTLGWPERTHDLVTYHPTSVINPGYEIQFLWVARMILMSGFLLGDIPFHTVYFHGMVRDKEGKKFSKSAGTGGDPIDFIEKYGTDALRMGLIVGVGPGNDSTFDEEKVKAYKLFANKLWNITRFILSSIEDLELPEKASLTGSDKLIIDEVQTLADEVTDDIENFNFHLSGERLYHYVWHTLADRIIEESKGVLRGGDREAQISMAWTLRYVLKTTLKLLHPFMPFITEEIWQNVPPDMREKERELLMVSSWPTA